MVRLGLDLPPELLALACASHSGEAFHIEGVRRILALGAGSTSRRCRPRPTTRSTTPRASSLIRAGGASRAGPRTARASTPRCSPPASSTAGTPRPTSSPTTRCSRASRATFAELTGEPVEVVAVDGCGAPLLSTSLVGLARALPAASASTVRRGRRPRAPGRRGDPRAPGVRLGHHARRVRAAPRDPRRDRQGRRRVRATPSRCPTAAPSRSRPTTAPPRVRAGADGRGAAPQPACSRTPGVDADAVRRTGVLELLGGGRPVGEIRAPY